MARLIDADKLIDFIDVGHLRHPGELCYSEADVANLLLHAPTLDAVEVVHGRWIQDKQSKFEHRYNCSACNYRLIDEHCNYCPNCGARMDGDENG